MPWRYALLHFAASLVLGSLLVVVLSFTAVNIAQGTLHFDGLGILVFLAFLYSFLLSIPGIGHLNLFYSRKVDQMDFDLFWPQFRHRYLLTTILYILFTTLLAFVLVGFNYPDFTWAHIFLSLFTIGVIIGTYAAVGWYVLSKLKERLRAAQ